MAWARHRLPLALAALLDAAGLVGLALGISQWRGPAGFPLQPGDAPLLLGLVLIYWSLGWLFGSYTLLKLRRVSWTQGLVRLVSTTAGSIALAAVLSYAFRLQLSSGLFFRGSLIPLFLGTGLWSAAVRALLRRHWPLSNSQRWQILAMPEEVAQVRSEWAHAGARGPCPPITALTAELAFPDHLNSEAVALSSGVLANPAMQLFCQEAVSTGQPVASLVAMAEQELQRIPPRWVGSQWLLFSGRIDGQRTTWDKQLKRYADVVLSLGLLVLSSPLLLLAGLLVKLQDGGPVFYRQRRSGLLGMPFAVFKIRTMVPEAEQGQPQWAQTNDSRITRVGLWLRRTRVDELPQLINVLRGEMSLIGPRPERPELEHSLEASIPNYRLRHWIRPGLSGWAQVNMPYGASVEDAELKLSYDLFYLRNASPWLDLLILLKTIKVVLKAAGR